MTIRVGCDIGGTFTDLVLADRTRTVTHKVLTTPNSPAQGALAGLDELLASARIGWDAVEELVHGTTLVTNALISRIGAPTALLTTRGFRDVLEFGRQQRYDAYNLRLAFPVPLVPRRWRRDIAERTLPDGSILEPLNEIEVARAAEELAGEGVEAFAISFLHSYKNPGHEIAAAATVRRVLPEAIVTTSHETSPVIREYERTTSTVASAYTQPIVTHYLERFREGLAERRFAGRFRLMQSSGGTAASSVVERVPIRLLESGPAGGARAAAQVGWEVAADPVVAFDMGGTTAKACLVRDERLDLSDRLEVARLDKFKPGSGMPVCVPTVDLIEIGTGGGSIASIDRLGMLQVGPKSAGADPGPACYGFGGTWATVTDADLVLGYINADSFAFQVDAAAAKTALGELADRLGLTVNATAQGVRRHANENMAAAARMHLVEKGTDPRRFTLVATGGAGPLHAVDVATLLGISKVVVPLRAGVMSAEGFLLSPCTYETSTSAPHLVDAVDWNEVRALYHTMEAEAAEALAEAGVPSGDVEFERHVELKLLGQVHELTIPVSELSPAIADDFLSHYSKRFGLVPPDMPVEILTWSLRATGRKGRQVRHLSAEQAHRAGTTDASRRVLFEGRRTKWPVHRRVDLRGRGRLPGPALIDDVDTTTVVRPGDTLFLDTHDNLIIELGA
jgi:5-oxoprolinase (ATP-hydrolysing)/N-methylhydantoinase A